MGYCIWGGGTFIVKKENFQTAKNALLEKWPRLCPAEMPLDDVLDICGLENAAFDEKGDLCDLYIDGRKLWDQAETLQTIAPWVEDGSRLEITGEDGDKWLWCVKDHVFYECPGEVSYRGDPYA